MNVSRDLIRGPDNPPEYVLSKASGVADAPGDFAWLEKNIPCQAACPAGTDIPGYLGAIAQGDFETAYRINLRDNVFPAVLGRVCTRPCEPACRHGWEGLGDPVAICFSKRSADDFARHGEPVVLDAVFPDTGKSVAVVGAGAAGLAAARELRLWGHSVTVFDKHANPGGLMTFGIPEFRLPKDAVDREIEQIRLLGVDIQCGVEIGKERKLDELRESHDALILATGALKPNIPDLPGKDLQGVRHCLGFLMEVNAGEEPAVGEEVVVVGGGFTAVDCARAAHRLGASKVTVYYRRSEAEMYITPGELDEMRNEGITFEPLVTPVAYEGENGALSAVRLCRTELGEPGEDGRRRPVKIEGGEFEVPASLVLLATGQVQDPDALGYGGEATGVFLTGDFASGAESLIAAIGDAKRCAREVDRFLMDEDRLTDIAWIEDAEQTGRTREMDQIPLQDMPAIPVAERGLRNEVDQGFPEDIARTEASRCYLCHFKFEIDNDLCIYCDRCLKVKPVEKCIVKISDLVRDDRGIITGYNESTGSRDYNLLFIDQNECIRCGACADVCPVECIPLQRVGKRCVRTVDLG